MGQHIGKAITTISDQKIGVFVILLLNFVQRLIQQGSGSRIKKGQGLAIPTKRLDSQPAGMHAIGLGQIREFSFKTFPEPLQGPDYSRWRHR